MARLDLHPDHFALLAERDHRSEDALRDELLAVNAELARLTRESTRQARALEASRAELDQAYWFLEKMQEKLPICLRCEKVRTGADSWQSLHAFLLEHSDFLSHGYCPDCAGQVEQEWTRDGEE